MSVANGKSSEKILSEVREILDDTFFLPSIETSVAYVRYEDDSKEGSLSVFFTSDSDGWIDVIQRFDPDEIGKPLRFRIPFIGGGKSHRVRNALLILAEAIRLDNEDTPQYNKGPEPEPSPTIEERLLRLADAMEVAGFSADSDSECNLTLFADGGSKLWTSITGLSAEVLREHVASGRINQ